MLLRYHYFAMNRMLQRLTYECLIWHSMTSVWKISNVQAHQHRALRRQRVFVCIDLSEDLINR